MFAVALPKTKTRVKVIFRQERPGKHIRARKQTFLLLGISPIVNFWWERGWVRKLTINKQAPKIYLSVCLFCISSFSS